MSEPFKPQAIIYCRVSTVDQVNDGSSLSVQENGCRQFIERQGWELAHEPWMEEGESAKTTDRTRLHEMMRWCEKNKDKVQHLVFYRISRFSRNTEDFVALKVFFRKLGIATVSVTEKTEDSPSGRFMENVLAGMAQLDNEVRADQSKNGLEDSVRNGRWVWQAPRGYRNSGGRKISNLLPEEPYATHISKAFDLVDNSYTPQEVANILKRDGFRSKMGKTIGVRELGKILRNPIYKGVIRAFGRDWAGAFSPLISVECFERVQAILEGRNHKQAKYSMQREDFPLRGFLLCSCGKRFMGSWSKGRTKRYAHYHCRSCKRKNLPQPTVHAEFDGFIAQHAIKPEFAAMLKIAITENVRSGVEDTERQRTKLSQRILELQGDQNSIAEKNIANVLDDDTARRMIGEKKKKIKECEHDRAILPSGTQRVAEVVEFGLKVLQDPRTAWNAFSLLQKQRFQSLLFPEGVTFDDGKCRTAKTALILQIKTTLHEGELSLVTPRGVEPRLQA